MHLADVSLCKQNEPPHLTLSPGSKFCYLVSSSPATSAYTSLEDW
jgi:hypothetical protein